MGGEINILANLAGVKQVAAGGGLSLALLQDGMALSWGGGGLGPIEIPPGLNEVVRIAAGYRHALALKSDGTVVGLGVPSPDLDNVMEIAAGFTIRLRRIASR